MLRIKELRTESGLTQKELGEKINSTSKNIWAYENNFATPPLDVLIRLSDLFKCSIDYLVSREDDYGSINIPVNTGEVLSTDESELLRLYRGLDEDFQRRAVAYMRRLFDVEGGERLIKPKKA